MYVYTIVTHTGELIPASSVADAKRIIHERYPVAHFTTWTDAERGRNLPAWESSSHALRYELGEIQDKNKPVAYVRVQDWEVKSTVYIKVVTPPKK